MVSSAKKKGRRAEDDATQKLSPPHASTSNTEDDAPLVVSQPICEKLNVAVNIEDLSVGSSKLAAPLTVPFVCLLCFRPTVADPVIIHDTLAQGMNPSVCLACNECAGRWLDLQVCSDKILATSPIHREQCAKCPICDTEGSVQIPFTRGMEKSSSSKAEGRDKHGGVPSFPSLSQWRRDHAKAGRSLPEVHITNPHTGESTNDRGGTSALGTRLSVDGRSSCGVVRFDTPSMMDLAPAAIDCSKTTTPAANHAEVESELNTHPTCGICEEAPGSVDCLVCGFSICEGCQSSVHAKGRYRQHKVVPIGEIAKVAPRRCPFHPTHNLDLYCRKCIAPVCVLCSFSADMHKGHDVVPLEEMAKETGHSIDHAISFLTRLVERSEHVGGWVTSQEASVSEKCESVVRSIQTHFSSLRKALDDREAELVDSVTTFHDHKMERLRAAKDIFRLLADDGSVVRTCVSALPTTMHPIVAVSLAPAIRMRMKAFQSQVASLAPNTNDLLQLDHDRLATDVVSDVGSVFIPDVSALRFEAPSTNMMMVLGRLGDVHTPKELKPATSPVAHRGVAAPRDSMTTSTMNPIEFKPTDIPSSPQVTTVRASRVPSVTGSRHAEVPRGVQATDEDPFHPSEQQRRYPTADGHKRQREDPDGDMGPPSVHPAGNHGRGGDKSAADHSRYPTETVSRRRQFLRFDEEPSADDSISAADSRPQTAPPAPAPRPSLHGIAKLFDTRPSRGTVTRQPEKKREGGATTTTTSTTAGGGIRLNIS